MSILQRIVRRRPSKFFAAPTARIRENRLRPRRPFGEGLLPAPTLANTPVVLSVHPVANHPGRVVALIEDEFWATRDPAEAARYHVMVMEGETELSHDRTFSLGDARALVRHLTTPLPTFPDSAYFEPTPADRLWWALHDHEFESEMDSWLDSCAPPTTAIRPPARTRATGNSASAWKAVPRD